jgi:hypothetical protein
MLLQAVRDTGCFEHSSPAGPPVGESHAPINESTNSNILCSHLKETYLNQTLV